MHAQEPLSPSEAIQLGWEVTKRSFAPAFLPLGVLSAVVSLADGAAHRGGHALANLVLEIAGIFLSIGWWRVALRAHDGRPVDLRALTETTLPTFLGYVVVIVLATVIVGIGLVALILPGLFFAARLALAPAIVVDEGLDPVGALRRSFELTEGRVAELWVLGLALVGINLIGLLLFGLGLFVTVPISYVAVAHVYRRLSEGAPSRAPHAPPRVAEA